MDHAAASGLIPRFGELIGRIKQAVADGAGRDTRRLGALSVLLWGYLGRALLRLAALETRRAAGTLRPFAQTSRPARRDRQPPSGTTTPAADGARIPYGPVLLRFHAAHLAGALERLIEEPEVQALLAAAPQAGRVLRPLWRMLSTDPPPPTLRLPPRKRRARTAIPPNPAEPATGEARPTRRRPPRGRRVERGAWWQGTPAARPLAPALRPVPAPRPVPALRPIPALGRIAPPRSPPPDW